MAATGTKFNLLNLVPAGGSNRYKKSQISTGRRDNPVLTQPTPPPLPPQPYPPSFIFQLHVSYLPPPSSLFLLSSLWISLLSCTSSPRGMPAGGRGAARAKGARRGRRPPRLRHRRPAGGAEGVARRPSPAADAERVARRPSACGRRGGRRPSRERRRPAGAFPGRRRAPCSWPCGTP